MLFNSYFFIAIFLPLTLVSYYFIVPLLNLKNITKIQCRLFVLLIASLIFYGYWNPKYLFLIGGSILFNFFLGLKIHSLTPSVSKKFLLFLGVFFNLSLLAYFKYANFFVDNLEIFLNTSIEWQEIVLPIAISFFTFQQIAYIVDVYNNKTNEYKLLNYSVFVSFFPQLIAGPIIYHNEVKSQYANLHLRKKIYNNISLGICIFVLGLFKKVVIADTLSNFSDPIFLANAEGENLVFIEAWIGILSYTFQLYFDFSGYSDMAVGLAKLFGINFPFNFNSPFKARNIIDFWKRWHITLSRFINDYLFTNIAIRFLRFSMKKNLTNLHFLLSIVLPVIITFSLSGLWHGASWNFLLWGTLHGFYIIICYFWGMICKNVKIGLSKNNIYRLFSILLTFICVTLSFVPFRSKNIESSISFYHSLIPTKDISLPNELIGYWQLIIEKYLNIIAYFNFNFTKKYILNIETLQNSFIFLIISFFIVWLFKNSNSFAQIKNDKLVFYQLEKLKINFLGVYFVYIMFFYCLISLTNIDTSPYIYFQF